MRDEDTTSSSTRIVWSVAGVAGALLLVWTSGWLPVDFGGGETGELLPDPGVAGIPSRSGDSPLVFDPNLIPPQSEPEIVDVPPAVAGTDPWDESWDDERLDPRYETPFNPNEPPAGPPVALDVPRIDPREPSDREVEPHAVAKPIVAPPTWRTADVGRVDPVGFERQDADPRVAAPRRAATLDLAAIDKMIRDGRIAEAHVELSRLYWDHPAARSTIQSRIDHTASIVFFEPDVHFVEPYVVAAGDRLSRIGERHRVPWQYIVRLNRVDPRTLRPGDELKVVPGPFHAAVDLSEFALIVHNSGLFVRRYDIGLGPDGPPPGRFTILEKRTKPEFRTPEGRVVGGDDPRNPLGPRWLGLGSGYALHGTADPTAVGSASGFGCLFLGNDELVEVYDLLGVGSEIVIEE